MAKNNIDLSVVLHDTSDYKDWLVELKERFYSHRLKASCATNGYLLDFYWKLGRDIEAKQYANTYGSGFYKNLSQDLKNEMPGVKGFSPTNLKYMSYFYKLYAPLQANCPQLADNFIEDLYIADIQRVVAQSKRGCVISLWRTLFVCFSVYFSWIVVFLHKGNHIILYRNFTFLVLSITKLRKSSQKGIIVPDGKTVQIDFYRFIPKCFFKLNPIPNNPMSM